MQAQCTTKPREQPFRYGSGGHVSTPFALLPIQPVHTLLAETMSCLALCVSGKIWNISAIKLHMQQQGCCCGNPDPASHLQAAQSTTKPKQHRFRYGSDRHVRLPHAALVLAIFVLILAMPLAGLVFSRNPSPGASRLLWAHNM